MILTTFTHILIDCFICFEAFVGVFFGSLYNEALNKVFEDKVSKVKRKFLWKKKFYFLLFSKT